MYTLDKYIFLCLSHSFLFYFLSSGMGLQAFVEAFFYLAQRRFKSLALREQVLSLLELCEAQLEPPGGPGEERRSLSCTRAPPAGGGRTHHQTQIGRAHV